jgi:hypothetical protein
MYTTTKEYYTSIERIFSTHYKTFTTAPIPINYIKEKSYPPG